MSPKPLVSKRFFRSFENEKSTGRQDHTTSPSAASTSSMRRYVHRIPPRVDDVAQRPSEWDGMATDVHLICISENQNIFSKGAGHDIAERARRANQILRTGPSDWMEERMSGPCRDGLITPLDPSPCRAHLFSEAVAKR
jgi:hypothetical protein